MNHRCVVMDASKELLCDTFATLKIRNTTIKLPIGRCYNFSVHRCGSRVEITSRYLDQQRSCHCIDLPNGL